MGNKQSSSSAINLTATNELIYNQLTTNETLAEANSTNVQELSINIGMTGRNCVNDFSQKISSNSIADTTAMPETIMDMKTEITQDLQAQAKKAMEQVTGAFSTSVGNKQATNTEVNTQIENVMNTTFETKNITETVTNAVNISDGQLIIGTQADCDDGGGLNFSQDIASSAVASAVTAAITKGIQDNKVLQTIKAELDEDISQQNRGPGESIAAMFEGMTTMFIIIGIVMIIACAGLAYVMLSPAGQGAITTAANTASVGANPLMALKK